MFANIFQAVSSDATCKALLGSNPVRFWPFGKAPQPGEQFYAEPYATYQNIYGSPDNMLSGGACSDDVTIQIDVYATSAAQLKNITVALRNALQYRCNIIRWGTEDIEEETKLHHYDFDVEWITPR